MDIIISLKELPVDFWYIDPPFFPTTRASPDVYRYEMSPEQHEEMLKVVIEADMKILLAGYACEMYDDYLTASAKWSRIDKVQTNHAAQTKKKSKRTLSLWRNYS